MPSDIVLAINALIKSGKEEGDPLTLPQFDTADIYPIFEHAFSEKAKATMAKHTKDLVFQYNEPVFASRSLIMLGKLGLKSCKKYADARPEDLYIRRMDLVHFIAKSATADKLSTAVEQVIATVNHVADLNFTKANLVQLSVIKFLPANRPEPLYAVISYVTLTMQGSEYVKQHLPDMFIVEGGVPLEV